MKSTLISTLAIVVTALAVLTGAAADDVDKLIADAAGQDNDVRVKAIRSLGLLGADAAAGLPTWERASEVIERVTLAVIPRPGVEPTDVGEMVGEAHWLDVPEIPLSGTMLRQRARAGGSIRFFVPELVHDYLIRHRLYE